MSGTQCVCLSTKIQGWLMPKNKETARYCKSLVGCMFYGETSNKFDGVTDHSEDKHAINLGTALQSVNVEMLEKKEMLDDNEFLEMAIKYRKPKDMELSAYKEKILKDKQIFLRHFKERENPAEQLAHKHGSYWGTRQQLRFGKVVGDWIDKEYGPIDPIFGVLLSPTGGLTGPGDSGSFHDALFDESGPFAYHSAVHDGFGYLFTNHDVGPGYKYLDAPSLFARSNPLSEQVSGIVFWKKVLKKHQKQKVESVSF